MKGADMQQINIHTHKRGNGIYILDISDGRKKENKELCSRGIHPLFVSSVKLEEIEQAAATNGIVAIGEAGLDRNSTVSLEEQLRLFCAEIEISEKYGLPLIIHCVKAYPELISLYRAKKPTQSWIIHGYNNNKEILTELLKHGFYISGGKNLMNPVSNISRLIPDIPLAQLFLETDDSDYTLEMIYTQAAKKIGISQKELENQLYCNFTNLFKNV